MVWTTLSIGFAILSMGGAKFRESRLRFHFCHCDSLTSSSCPGQFPEVSGVRENGLYFL